MKKALLLLAICLMVSSAVAQTIMLDHGIFRDGLEQTNVDAFLDDTDNGVAVARSLPDTVRIDGELSNLGAAARKYGLPYAIQPGDETAEDGSAVVYFLNSYDLAELYIVVDVTDDYINTASVNPWEDDNVEIFVDFDNSKIVTESPFGWPPDDYDTNDAQIRIVVARDEGAVTTAVSERTGDDTGNGWTFLGSYTQRCEPFATGYSAMVALPMASFESTVTPGEGTYPIPNGIMGVNIQVTDLDDEEVGNRQTGTLFPDHDYTSPATWGELFLYTYTDINEGTPTIDGTIGVGEWDASATHGMLFFNGGVFNDDDADFQGMWQALWDETALYVLTVITDQTLTNTSEAAHEKDNVEIFIDLDNSKVAAGYGDNSGDLDAQQFRAIWDTGIQQGTATVAQADIAGGYVMEWQINWADYEGFPATEFIGFDVHAGDSDDGSTRDGVIMWYESHSDNAWQDESVFGVARLVTGAAGVNDWTVLDQ
jgi:hypothetical protein